jgi:TatD DNase family protein
LFDVHTHQPKENAILNCLATEKTPTQWFSVGIHPWYLENLETQFSHLQEKAKDNNCLAIGEFGFDRLCGTSLETQAQVFDFQYQLAHLINKPIIIHCVRAFDLLIPKIKNSKVAIIIHGFNQNETIFNQLLALPNLYFSFGAAIKKENSNAQKALKKLDKDHFFLETDDQSEIKIEELYAIAAKSLNLSLLEVENQLEKNKNTIFR